MKIESKNNIVDKYKQKILGYSGYLEHANFYSDDLTDENKLHQLLTEAFTHEGDITSDGIKFLEDYYGFDYIAGFLTKLGGLDAEYRTVEEIKNWLQEFKEYTNSQDWSFLNDKDDVSHSWK
jgi:hypothetical protein